MTPSRKDLRHRLEWTNQPRAQKPVVVRAETEIRVIAADLLDELAPEERARARNTLNPTHQIDVGVVDRGHSLDMAALVVDADPVRIDEQDLRLGFEHVDEGLDEVGRLRIVRVDDADVLAGDHLERPIDRARLAHALVPNASETPSGAGGHSIEHFGRLVRRTIVNDDELDGFVLLREQGLERFLEQSCAIARRCDEGNERRHNQLTVRQAHEGVNRPASSSGSSRPCDNRVRAVGGFARFGLVRVQGQQDVGGIHAEAAAPVDRGVR